MTGADPGGRLPRRLLQLYAGLLLYGASAALLVRPGWGSARGTCSTRGLRRAPGCR